MKNLQSFVEGKSNGFGLSLDHRETMLVTWPSTLLIYNEFS